MFHTQIRIAPIGDTDVVASRKASMQELAERINRLKLALTLLCMHFPTDDDMQAAGWSTQEVSAACDAYDHARSVLNKEQKA